MERRQLVRTFGLALLAAKIGPLAAGPHLNSVTRLALWPAAPPGGGGPTQPPHISRSGALSRISVPYLDVVTPANPNGHAVLIAAGGGYQRIEMAKEAWPAAHWLTARGYTACVLGYRLPGEGWHEGAVVALQDAQRALRLLRARYQRVSVLGFSAGGHLLGLAAARSDYASYPPQDAYDSQPARADRAALIYPVVTLEPPFSHTATHRVLVGRDASVAEDAAWSLQTWITPHAPPFFLVQAEDDPVSDPHNTLILAAACRQQGVAVEMHRYSRGGHGFGMGRPGTPTLAWPHHYQRWLERR